VNRPSRSGPVSHFLFQSRPACARAETRRHANRRRRRASDFPGTSHGAVARPKVTTHFIETAFMIRLHDDQTLYQSRTPTRFLTVGREGDRSRGQMQ
jgi:hypothetical protein